MAQDAPKPQLRSSGPAPITAPTTATTTEQLGLIPEAPLERTEKPKGNALEEPDSSAQRIDRSTAAEDEIGARIRLRQLTTRVRNEPKVQAELERANSARTDLEKREALKAYYQLLYSRIGAIDPSLAKRVQVLRARSIHRLAQTRIDPTDPIDPGLSEEPTARR
jgi:hypothetical protein